MCLWFLFTGFHFVIFFLFLFRLIAFSFLLLFNGSYIFYFFSGAHKFLTSTLDLSVLISKHYTLLPSIYYFTSPLFLSPKLSHCILPQYLLRLTHVFTSFFEHHLLYLSFILSQCSFYRRTSFGGSFSKKSEDSKLYQFLFFKKSLLFWSHP